MNITTELSSQKIRPADFADSAYQYEVQTPAYHFTTVVATLSGPNSFVALVARNSFDPALASAVLQFVRNRSVVLGPNESVRILPDFSHADYPFDCVLVVGPKAHVLFQNESAALHSQTLELIPIRHCEFSGDETPDLFQLIRRKFVSTLDWRRTPSPRIWMSFHDFSTGVRSTGQKPGLATAAQATHQIHQLIKDPRSWVEIANYLGQSIRLSVEDHVYLARQGEGGNAVRINESEIDEWTNQFLMEGIDAPAGKSSK
jgi:hypothetical protein